eukprot:Hpha_TRINITY_DN21715_c0_g1::TRINITY_DN21715_c0_g1_i1::g.194190::m.194190
MDHAAPDAEQEAELLKRLGALEKRLVSGHSPRLYSHPPTTKQAARQRAAAAAEREIEEDLRASVFLMAAVVGAVAVAVPQAHLARRRWIADGSNKPPPSRPQTAPGQSTTAEAPTLPEVPSSARAGGPHATPPVCVTPPADAKTEGSPSRLPPVGLTPRPPSDAPKSRSPVGGGRRVVLPDIR